MGCVSSNLLSQDEELAQLGSSSLGHHIVSLTSTTYGLLTLDPPSEPKPQVINSWELMSGLEAQSFRKPKPFPALCPPNGENRVVIYTTSLRGVRKTFEACNAVRSAFEALGVQVCERDVSMHAAFRDELRLLLKGKPALPPRVFVKGLYIGGADDILCLADEGLFSELLQGLPRKKPGAVCDGCGDMRFLPCSHCSGSCKALVRVKEDASAVARTLVVKCSRCNENGLVLCPLCS
ncbi:hypothetical protein Fmac_003642 [Flemingia macrophylla]|uniref:Glutaredoxin domain-containing protein n=1 Tax=Flemingia macrophylla TaxID=520843 RepID=A0ABD1N2N5_9FABA